MNTVLTLNKIIAQLKAIEQAKTNNVAVAYDTPSSSRGGFSSRAPYDVGLTDLETTAQIALKVIYKHLGDQSYVGLEPLSMAINLVQPLQELELSGGLSDSVIVALDELYTHLSSSRAARSVTELKLTTQMTTARKAEKILKHLGYSVTHTTIRTWGKEGKIKMVNANGKNYYRIADVAERLRV